MTTTDLESPSAHFQAFRAPGEKDAILIPVVRHPATNDLYVIWGDISDCFPDVVRVMYTNVFIPMLRGNNLYRVKPFGIKYHPGIILDIICGKKVGSSNRKSRSSRASRDAITVAKIEHHHTVLDKAPVQEAVVDGVDGDNKGDDDERVEEEPEPKPDQDEDDSLDLEGELYKIVEEELLDKTRIHLSSNKAEQPLVSKDDKGGAGEISGGGYLDDKVMEMKEALEVLVEEKVEEKEELIPAPHEIQVHHAHQETGLTIEDLIRHRVKDIFKSRYSWAQSNGHSRLFIFLPVLKASPTLGSAKSTQTTLATNTSTGTNKSTKFQLYYLCDCGNIPESQENASPHWIDKDDHQRPCSMPSSDDLSQQQLRSFIPLVGHHVMGVLEMFKHGVYIDKAPQEVAQRVSLMIEYLESKGIRSCQGFMAAISSGFAAGATESILEQFPPIAALDEKALSALKTWTFRDYTKQYAALYPFRTSEGDVRWTCEHHWKRLWPDFTSYGIVATFHGRKRHEGWYSHLFGVLCSRVTTMGLAMEYFGITELIPQNPVFTIWLDFNLTLKDVDELARVLGRLSAAVIHFLVRSKTEPDDEKDSGIHPGHLQLMAAALRNPNVEMFTLTEVGSDTIYGFQEPPLPMNILLSYRPKAGQRITTIERGVKGGKINAVMRVTNANLAIATIRHLAGGFHHFSELRFGHRAHHLTFNFADIKDGETERDGLDDMDVTSTNIVSYLDKRQWRDEVICSSNDNLGVNYLRLRCLTNLTMKVALDKERSLVRDVIMLNEHLKFLTLETGDPIYDPSQAYETCKQALFDHSTIEEFKITSLNGAPLSPSTFIWKHPNDLAKMRVDIVCNRADRVEAMFQRYGPLIERLEVEGLSLTDATAMDKLARRKKRPLAPTYLLIKNVHLMEPAVREILQDVVVKGDTEHVVVHGSVIPHSFQPVHGGKRDESMNASKLEANVKIWTEFLVAVRAKVTEFSIRDDSKKRFLRAMELQPAVSLEMPRLTSLHLLCAMDSSLFDRPWLDMLLEFKCSAAQDIEVLDEASNRASALEVLTRKNQMVGMQPFTELRLYEVMMKPDDWTRLMRYMDFSQIVNFVVQQKNAMSKEVMLQIADVVPRDSAVLKMFHLRAHNRNDDDTIAALLAKFGSKRLAPGGPIIDLNEFIV
ncbi:hypothetical protein BGZ95_003232 [Linnemannia exigua]|uniref:Uncharacterized protein n=1 Tax=Linnemannia exigua TaxID=604196 RepID=A0AAD4D4G0_9FUNG|nr:hypothetical protein BGZ95_003232 [Linnemannia exigua]